MKHHVKSETGFTVVEAVVLALVVGILSIIGYEIYKAHTATTGKGTALPEITSTTQQMTRYAHWSVGTFHGDTYKLQVRYPNNWTASTDATTQDLLLQKASGKGTFTIRLGFAAGGEIANMGAPTGYKPVSIFIFDGHQAYIVADDIGGMYMFSSCKAPGLCFFAPKTTSRYKGISEELTYNTPGAQDELVFPNDAATLNEARQIMTTLAYQ